MPRMHILNSLERETFEQPPDFNSAERNKYFDFPVGILDIARSLRSATNQVCFLASCAYLLATKRFFSPQNFRQRDLEYAAQMVNGLPDEVNPRAYDKQTLLRHQQLIGEFYGFREFDYKVLEWITGEIGVMVQSQLKPKLILFRVIDSLIREKICPPSYDRLRKLILDGINRHKKDLIKLINKQLSDHLRSLLDQLLEKETTDDGVTINRYRLTLLKRFSQSTKPSKVKESIADLELVQVLCREIKPILNSLSLTHEGIRYYANSVIKSEIFQVARRSQDDRHLHLVAFITHQYYRLQDNLIDVLLKVVQSYVNMAQREHKEACYKRRAQRNQLINELLNYLDTQFIALLTNIKEITEHEHIEDAEKVERIKSFLKAQETARRQAEVTLAPLRQEFEREIEGNDYYRILERKSVRIQNRVAPIIKALSFQSEAGSDELIAAIGCFKDKDGAVDKTTPMGFLKPVEQRAVLGDDGKFRVSLYKALFFIHIMRAIKSGTLNLQRSYKYRALDDYMIDRDRWQRERKTLLERAGLSAFGKPQKVLNKLDEVLYEQYFKTNQNLLEGKNTLVRFVKDGAIRSINTPKLDDSASEPLQTFFPERQYISLLEVLSTVEHDSDFLDEFQHWQQRYHRPKPPRKTFFAGVIGLGCSIGTRKIARISRQIRETELENTVNWFFSPETTQAANDKVVHLMDRMDLPNVYRRSQDALHTSSDGQKFEVKPDSLNASYSFKYFGKSKGVSVYSFIDERHLLFHSTVISAAERESAYVIDGLMHNDVVKSDIHSTDTHGYSEVIFGAMHLLGFSYAPRIKNLKRQRIYIFKSRKGFDRSQFKVAPTGYIDTQLIEDNWDDILRFIATIKLKETTASELFRRLNSYSKQHTLYGTLKAFGKIIKSIFILRYINDLELRQAIEKQLNKIESSHRFARAVSVGNPREFTEADKQEQEIAEACKRLIKNAIICWNYLYLSQKISDAEDSKYRDTLVQAVAGGSVVFLQHINLLGEYDFSDEKLEDSVGIKPPKLAA